MTTALSIASHGRLGNPSGLSIGSVGRLSAEALVVETFPRAISRAGGYWDWGIDKPWEYVREEEARLKAILMDDDEVLLQ